MHTDLEKNNHDTLIAAMASTDFYPHGPTDCFWTAIKTCLTEGSKTVT